MAAKSPITKRKKKTKKRDTISILILNYLSVESTHPPSLESTEFRAYHAIPPTILILLS